MRIKSALVLTLGASLLLGGAVSADELVRHVDKKHKFKLEYPKEWTRTLNQNNVTIDVTSADKTAKVQLMVQPIKGRVTARKFLESMEEKMGGRTNVIPETHRGSTPAAVKALGAEDYWMGAYKLEVSGVPMLQAVGVAIKKRRAFILIQTLAESTKDKHAGAVGNVAKSLRLF